MVLTTAGFHITPIVINSLEGRHTQLRNQLNIFKVSDIDWPAMTNTDLISKIE